LSFQEYSAYYDLFYTDKNYESEVGYVTQTLRTANPPTRSILELGSGTGRHGRLLAGMGFDVHGVELSSDMASVARSSAGRTPGGGTFSCDVGDLRRVRVGRTFDAVISLFHVISYQTTNDDLRAAFKTAAVHLEPGGAFFFDVWHGPAVLATPPSIRTKEVANQRYRVKRTARPEHDADRATVRVVYEFDCEDLENGQKTQFIEEHLMRYLFPSEVKLFAAEAGFTILATEEFLTGRPPSAETWGVGYLLQR
jgi:SAM-dependent methyltransferase